MKTKKYCVLIIDDDAFYCEFYRAELSQHDFAVELASDGEEGVEKAKKLKPDIILLDIILPKKDGFEVLKDLKKNKRTKNIPVIITSTLGNNTDILKLKDMGAVNNFNKASALPKDIALYIEDILAHGTKQAKLSPEMQLLKTNSEPTQISREKAKSIFQDGEKEIEKALVGPLGTKMATQSLDVSVLSPAELEAKINEIASMAGTILIYSEIQTRRAGLVILSIKRDDALALMKLLEDGSLGNCLGPDENDMLLGSFFNIMLTAFISKLSASLSNAILSKPPAVVGPHNLPNIFQKINTFENDTSILMQVAYLIESAGVSFSFYAYLGEETLVQDKDKSKDKAKV